MDGDGAATGGGDVGGGSIGAGGGGGRDEKKSKKNKKNKKIKGGSSSSRLTVTDVGSDSNAGGMTLRDLPAGDVVVKAVLLTVDDARHIAAKLGAGAVDGSMEEGDARAGLAAPKPCSRKAASAGEGRPRVLPLVLSAVESMSLARVFLPEGKGALDEERDGTPGKGLRTVGDKLVEVLRRFDGNPPLLDEKKDLGLEGNSEFERMFEEAKGLE